MKYVYCPNCGKENLKHEQEKSVCKDCGYIIYQNAVVCASVLPVKNGKVLLAVRKNDPFKGEYDLIGGFANPNESAEEAAVREAKEETGLDVKIVKYFGSYPDRYGKDGVYALNIQFIVEIIGGSESAKDDVAGLEWIPIVVIPNLKLNGFKNTRETLTDFYKKFVSRGAGN
jgi:NAD+ diphosphatase